MINFKLDIHNFLQNQSDIDKTSTSNLVLAYYIKKGISDETTVEQWITGLAKNDYPSYTAVYALIKQYKKDNHEIQSNKKK